ncbi:hypothetical protein KB879_33920 (plasmid) [Cupriavidus sp. KK10]|jgi:hypothetical protein|uniref:hypothetical protein n=1 Tax=Cupriavidus sp. KK10 TaxID=1478019 RepID=UPI001BA67813|nr:hypothetical protein [Cupriavidus sp. KK10]QUN32603.1 hypothetical protein KB879_33920 [Cupriavidus sp. KK10]
MFIAHPIHLLNATAALTLCVGATVAAAPQSGGHALTLSSKGGIDDGRGGSELKTAPLS